MSAHELHLQANDGHQITGYHWQQPDSKAVILLLHGMTEHAARYRSFAETLNKAGYSVVAPNHRGHGPHIPQQQLGWFAESNGWQKVLGDISLVHSFVTDLYPDIPVILMGHSMGSFLAQAWLLNRPEPVSGTILSGSNFAPRLLLKLGKLVAILENARQGTNGHSKLIDTLSFGSYNNAFKPVRTPFDWLSRDSAEVNKYIEDPLCGFLCTNVMWLDLFNGLLSITSIKALKNIDNRLPFYIFGGSKDPVGQQGKGLKQLANSLSKAGSDSITLEIWPEGRHEMLNETNRQEVVIKLLQWLDQQVQNFRSTEAENHG
ncbi:alpha/beta hydrolase [Sansalvadorimonas sp. 2012CJ34-2]|uniref:Alpha/beta hydrolase n=1 Tax=Parendozoicomonas callyspongiae TaxID=2942213 RepID=A0ABT0PD52_9GAMM|nr:alpha/beta hydrolase [Sansalvadorimonas sp. 2012CJ34-2]MCL6269294.1 alpha/beta hydrolase [Sansalvadorimonas sp. 2012CJ34-2]